MWLCTIESSEPLFDNNVAPNILAFLFNKKPELYSTSTAIEKGKLFETAIKGILVDIRPYYKAKNEILLSPLNMTHFPLRVVTAE